ncbi:MAG: DUF4129 domain-containing protein [Gemmatimonadota bacterium]|nr:DUF4129 domain-containing protein [Gemmatimonadota bacterium]MDH5283417.1 DUF4129 domain-containing protein [Gemmatimonadota bacterium]
MSHGVVSLSLPPADDSLRAVLDSVFASASYEWSPRPDPLAFLRHAWLALQHWLESLAHNHPDLYVALLWGAVAVLAGIVLHASWVLLKVVGGATAPRSVSDGPASPMAPSSAWYRAEAGRLAREGRYAEAMRADFRGLILELDARSVVRFHPSKTPFEYAREPGLSPPDRGWLERLAGSLYRFAYAGEPCGPAEYAGWQRKAEWHAAPH